LDVVTTSRVLSRHPIVNLLYSPVRWLPTKKVVGKKVSGGTVRKAEKYPEYGLALGWGRKASGRIAIELAESGHVESATLLEDGFIRSVGREDNPLSVVVDGLGVHYDASGESTLERLISERLTAEEVDRCRHVLNLWRCHRVSKYNSGKEYQGVLPQSYVLVIDQVLNDLSIECGRASQASFDQMLQSALDENPESQIILKVHPDALTRKKVGHFDLESLAANPRIQVISEACHPTRLIEHAQSLYAVTSQMGFEALIWGKKVRCFGMPFYAGWGLTDDHLTCDRRHEVSLEQLVYAVLIKYSRYALPYATQLCSVEEVIRFVGLQRSHMFCYSESLAAYGFSRRKRKILRAFLGRKKGRAGSDPTKDIRFISNPAKLRSEERLLVWGSKSIPPASMQSNLVPKSVMRVEDGFLRSRGLGADLIAPKSWVIDDQGIYYDARSASRLETLLQEHDFDEELLARAQMLSKRILEFKVSKYNLRGAQWQRPSVQKTLLLVPGQVENDASIRFGALGEVNNNQQLLEAVRRDNPDAWILYKPHPDVVAKLRKGKVAESSLGHLADEVVMEADILSMLEQVDEVHTMTSLTGFEALLRGKKVTCYGMPFYAGWGLTEDKLECPRRSRKLTLDQLVAATLILYPTYISSRTGYFSTPEAIVEELADESRAPICKPPLVRRFAMRVFGWVKSL
jgi:capsular polysaccharide export protein